MSRKVHTDGKTRRTRRLDKAKDDLNEYDASLAGKDRTKKEKRKWNRKGKKVIRKVKRASKSRRKKLTARKSKRFNKAYKKELSRNGGDASAAIDAADNDKKYKRLSRKTSRARFKESLQGESRSSRLTKKQQRRYKKVWKKSHDKHNSYPRANSDTRADRRESRLYGRSMRARAKERGNEEIQKNGSSGRDEKNMDRAGASYVTADEAEFWKDDRTASKLRKKGDRQQRRSRRIIKRNLK